MGQYSLVQTVLNMLMIFTVFGIDKGLVKYIPRYNTKKDKDNLFKVIKISVIYGFIFSLIGALLIFLFKGVISYKIFNDPELFNALKFGAWIIIPLTLIQVFGGLFRGFKKLSPFIISKNILLKLFFIIFILLNVIIFKKGINNILIFYLISHILAFLYLYHNKKILPINLFEIINTKYNNKNIKRTFFKFTKTMILISFMAVILNKIDRIMLGIFMSSDIVGIYSIAAKIAALGSFILLSSNMIFSSIISELFSSDKLDLLHDIYRSITKWVFLISFSIINSFWFFPKIMLRFFGEEYIIGSLVLIILSISRLIEVIPGANGYLLSMTGRENINLFNNIIMAFTNIVLNIILIPLYGMIGAAIATAISISLVNIIKIILVKYYLNFLPYSKKAYKLLLNIVIIIGITLLFNPLITNITGVIILTGINLIISIMITYYISSEEIDKYIFDKIFNQFKKNIL